MTDRQHDLLVEQYLASVAQAGADLPPDQREELLADLREHITTARADLSPETEAGVKGILSRLGDPASIVVEARDQGSIIAETGDQGSTAAEAQVVDSPAPESPKPVAAAPPVAPPETPRPPTMPFRVPMPSPMPMSSAAASPPRGVPWWGIVLLTMACVAAMLCVGAGVLGWLFAPSDGGPIIQLPAPTQSPSYTPATSTPATP